MAGEGIKTPVAKPSFPLSGREGIDKGKRDSRKISRLKPANWKNFFIFFTVKKVMRKTPYFKEKLETIEVKRKSLSQLLQEMAK
ncbi:MAG: hypothetical protein QW788_02405, partial [Candidatus Hadarchaeales archaeon]